MNGWFDIARNNISLAAWIPDLHAFAVPRRTARGGHADLVTLLETKGAGKTAAFPAQWF